MPVTTTGKYDKLSTHEIFEILLHQPSVLACVCIPLLLIVILHAIESMNKYKHRQINKFIRKDQEKVVDKLDIGLVDIEELAEFSNGRVILCRCWHSQKVCSFFFDDTPPFTRFSFSFRCYFPILSVVKFPFCDGSHNDHNHNTRDNVGPLIIIDSRKRGKTVIPTREQIRNDCKKNNTSQSHSGEDNSNGWKGTEKEEGRNCI